MDKNVWDVIKTRRSELKITQKEMGEHLGIKNSSYSEIENNITPVKLVDFLSICNKLNLNPLVLLKDSNDILVTLTKDQSETILDLAKQIKDNLDSVDLKLKNTLISNHKR